MCLTLILLAILRVQFQIYMFVYATANTGSHRVSMIFHQNSDFPINGANRKNLNPARVKLVSVSYHHDKSKQDFNDNEKFLGPLKNINQKRISCV